MKTNLTREEAIEWIKSDSPLLNDCDDAIVIFLEYIFDIKEQELK